MSDDQKPTDLLKIEDIAEMYGWTHEEASTLMRNLGRRGLVVKFEGHRRLYVTRQNLERAIRRVHASSSGGTR